MDPNNLLSFLDMLDLDENIIDERLQTIIHKQNLSNKNLMNAIQLLQYKKTINTLEGTECENDNEYKFAIKLISTVEKCNVDLICKILQLVLFLNETTIVSKSEHILQQLLSIETFDAIDSEKQCMSSFYLMLSDSILDAAIESKVLLNLLYFELPLKNILFQGSEELMLHFLANTVPKFVQCVNGFDILDNIWNLLSNQKWNNRLLKVLCMLSNFYLPILSNGKNIKYESKIVYNSHFWKIIISGLQSDINSDRKFSLYLVKRALDYVQLLDSNISLHPHFHWIYKEKKQLKNIWDSFFLLLDSLEEKQSNIVIPSLHLFEKIKELNQCWYNCAFKLGLKHDNDQIRTKCIEYKLSFEMHDENDAILLLEALNNMNVFHNKSQSEIITNKITKFCCSIENMFFLFDSLPKIKWSPVPLYYVTEALKKSQTNGFHRSVVDVSKVKDILKITCNNKAIRKAININMSYISGHFACHLSVKELVLLASLFNFDVIPKKDRLAHPIIVRAIELYLCEEKKSIILDLLFKSYNSEIILCLFEQTYNIPEYSDFISLKLFDFNRQLSIINEKFITESIFLLKLIKHNNKYFLNKFEPIQMNVTQLALDYLHYLVKSNDHINIEQMEIFVSEMVKIMCGSLDQSLFDQHCILSVKILEDKKKELDNKTKNLLVIKFLVEKRLMHYKMLNLSVFLSYYKSFHIYQKEYESGCGKMKNKINELSCNIVYCLIQNEELNDTLQKELLQFINEISDCGGYGCLKWVIKILNLIIPSLTKGNTFDKNIIKILNRIWKEIEDIKSNSQYSICMEEFVIIITQESLVNNSVFHNTIIYFCNKINECGSLKNTPLYFLCKNFQKVKLSNLNSYLLYVLCDMLLFNPVIKKDNRLLDNIAASVLRKYNFNQKDIGQYFNHQIQYSACRCLLGIDDEILLVQLSKILMSKTDYLLQTKQRYHGNSQTHKTLLIGLQHLLVLVMRIPHMSLDFENIYNWSLRLLGKLPHQPSVKVLLEWTISLQCYMKNTLINEDFINILETNRVPLNSQMLIMYYVLKANINNSRIKEPNGDHEFTGYNFVMDSLLSYIMGQKFSLRAQSQLLAIDLYKLGAEKDKNKYTHTINLIEKSLKGAAVDCMLRFKNDYFMNNFDIVQDLKPVTIYYFLPKYFGLYVDIDEIDVEYLKDLDENFTKFTCIVNSGALYLNNKTNEFYFNYNFENDDAISKERNQSINNDEMCTVQKKYVPWTSMNEIEVYQADKKNKVKQGDMVVVASLVDKLPNLGGMARTSEVFGVKTYVVDSLRHLQDKQFQGLSVSAERWVNIEEVRPGTALKDYLMNMKSQGYALVAAEQTSSSVKLHNFKFPKKTLLLLGHEKDGVPCDLLPIMDHCVEIPQQGYVRSLNVHVTAAIFVWEYTRQNLLI